MIFPKPELIDGENIIFVEKIQSNKVSYCFPER